MKYSAHNIFDKSQEKQIIEAIRDAENMTSGEIRVHIEDRCPIDPVERAIKVFEKLNMQNTQHRNGVLIYLAVKDHKFAIIGDKGIDDVVPPGFWDSTKEIMLSHFKKDEFLEGLVASIRNAGNQLKHHFPISKDDSNELPDDISYS